MSYDDIRTALNNGFFLENLYRITRLGHDLLLQGPEHPSAAYAIAATAQKVAWWFEGYPPHDELMALVEAHIKPKMERVLAAVPLGGDALVKALDELSIAYSESTPILKSVGAETGPLSECKKPFQA